MSDSMSEPEIVDSFTPREYRPLSERLDGPIEDVSIGVSALLAKIVRQSLRNGIQKLDEGLEVNVRDKIEDDLRRRGPILEEAARTVARTEMQDRMETLTRQARESGAKMQAQIESLVENLKNERETRHGLQAETDAYLRQIRTDLAGNRSEWEAELRTARESLNQLLEKTRADLASLKNHSDRETAAIGTRLDGALAKLESGVGAQLQTLARAAESQKQIIALQQQAIADLEAKTKMFRGAIDAAGPRIAALEEKVFRPGFFSRIFGGGKKHAEE